MTPPTRREFVAQTAALAAGAVLGLPRASAQSMVSADPLCFESATALVGRLRRKELSARELMATTLGQISRINPKINAIVAKLDDDACLKLADAADRAPVRGPLHGLPFAFKDTEPAIGFPFTRGSVLLRNNYPKEDSLVVARLRGAGVVPIGKTNVPEFAMGSQTYNRVYGRTRNPYDLTKTVGGSSGGAGAALAAGLLAAANGSDLGGSLRNPGNFNNVVGFRPTVGLVPTSPTFNPFVTMTVKGPLARSVEDIALLMSVLSGPDSSDPGCYPSSPDGFLRPLGRDLRGVRVAWCPDLGGLPLEPAVLAVLEAQRATFERLGCIVEEAVPDFTGAEEAFVTMRNWNSYNAYHALVEGHREDVKPEALEEIDRGGRVTIADLTKALHLQAQLMLSTARFQERYEVIACCVNQVAPFDVNVPWPHEIAGQPMRYYTDWMKSAYLISATGHPAISVPAGFTPSGLPVGIQLVGRHRRDFDLLQIAHAFEQATQVGRRRPALSSGAGPTAT